MTQRRFNSLIKVRQQMSLIGWILMVINLHIGISLVIASIIRGVSLFSHPNAILTLLIISIVIGIFALTDMLIFRRLFNAKVIQSPEYN